MSVNIYTEIQQTFLWLSHCNEWSDYWMEAGEREGAGGVLPLKT